MMSDGALSQDEIEALLQGADDAFGAAPVQMAAPGASIDKKLLNEAAKIIADNQAFSLSSLSTKTATIFNVTATTGDFNNLHQMLAGKLLEAKVSYSGSLQGNVYYYMRESEAIIVAGLMMGQQESSLTDMVSQVLREAFSQMVGVADSALAARFGGSFTNAPIEMNILEDAFSINMGGSLAIVSASLSVEGEIDNAPYVFAMDLPLAQALLGASTKPVMSQPSGQQSGGGNQGGGGFSMDNTQSLGIQQADFNSLRPAADVQGSGNIGLLMDVTMNMTVELGRASMTIRDILSLGEGSIIELQKLAGEPVDLLVNGKLIARGEVVVIDENFGVRVTDIINPMDRFAAGGKNR